MNLPKRYRVVCDDCQLDKIESTKKEAKAERVKHEKKHPKHRVAVFTRGWILSNI